MMKKSPISAAAVYILLILCTAASAQTAVTRVVCKQEHIVKKGQIAVQIAKKYGVDVAVLQKLNPGRDLKKLQIGDRIIVGETAVNQPAVNSSEKTTAPSATEQEKPKARPDKIVMMEQAEKREKTQNKEGSGVIGTAFSMILKLGIVLVLAYLTILALKLLSDKRDASPRLRRDIRVMDTVRLSNTSSLHLVDVNGRTLLLGSSTGQVNLLREFDKEEAVQPLVGEGKFAEHLAKYSGQSARNTPAMRLAGALRDCAVYLKDRRHRLSDQSARKAGDPE